MIITHACGHTSETATEYVSRRSIVNRERQDCPACLAEADAKRRAWYCPNCHRWVGLHALACQWCGASMTSIVTKEGTR